MFILGEDRNLNKVYFAFVHARTVFRLLPNIFFLVEHQPSAFGSLESSCMRQVLGLLKLTWMTDTSGRATLLQ